MAESEPFRVFWEFSLATRQETRYILDGPIAAFLQRLTAIAEDHTRIIVSGEFFWRAQEGHSPSPAHDDIGGGWPIPFGPERMKPPRGHVPEGRANPTGIPYLYLASDPETAIAEIRPWIDAHVSLGKFKALRDLKTLNCMGERKSTGLCARAVAPTTVQDERLWGDVGNAFARPVTRRDSTVDYVPTQIIAEWFKTRGFDGIAYCSSVGKGHNVVLFDLNAADLIECRLHRVTSAEFRSEECTEPVCY